MTIKIKAFTAKTQRREEIFFLFACLPSCWAGYSRTDSYREEFRKEFFPEKKM